MSLWLLLFPFILGLSCNHAGKTDAESETKEMSLEQRRERHLKAMRLDSLLCNRAFGEALLFLDSLHQQYPQDPQFYFCEGWVYDMQDDSTSAHAAFRKARALYDSLILKNDDLGDKINRAFLTHMPSCGQSVITPEKVKVAFLSGEKSAILLDYDKMYHDEKLHLTLNSLVK